MPVVHEVVGFGVVGVFTVGWVWGLVALITKRDPGQGFWTWLVVAQILAGVQAVLGIVLLLLGYRPDTPLHYVYGFGPLVVLLIAHQMAGEIGGLQGGRLSQPWVVFAAASFICFGLSGRALMTGLGLG
jgi:heme A synthase